MMQPILKLHRVLAANVNANPGDVWAAKTFLQDQGFYQPPGWGLTKSPDQALFDAIRAFQKSQGLRVDGVMKPKGKTERATQKIQAIALNRQSRNRNGDVTLNGDTTPAYTTPAEAMMLENKPDAGTINFNARLLASSGANKDKGQYIWHTVGDGKVRSSHAERDGETFSWDNPPEGGHPGEAPNCRCTAEDLKASKAVCKALKHQIDNQEIAVREAEREWAFLNKKYDNAKKLQRRLKEECKNTLKKSGAKAIIGGGAGMAKGGATGAIWGVGKAAITSASDIHDACSAADNQQEKVDEFLKRRNSAEQYMQDQRAILKNLRLKLADSGCSS